MQWRVVLEVVLFTEIISKMPVGPGEIVPYKPMMSHFHRSFPTCCQRLYITFDTTLFFFS